MSHLLFEILAAIRSLHAYLISVSGNNYVKYGAFLSFWVATTSLFIPISTVLIDSIAVEAPAEFAAACAILLPSNTVPCFVAIATAKITAALYKKKVWIFKTYLGVKS